MALDRTAHPSILPFIASISVLALLVAPGCSSRDVGSARSAVGVIDGGGVICPHAIDKKCPVHDAGVPDAHADAAKDADRDAGDFCPRTQGFWKNHPEEWPVNTLTLGGVVYTQAELLALLNTPTRGDASIILARQLIAALLNVASGADTTASVDDAIADAQAWLAANADMDGRLPFGTQPGSAAHQEATAIADELAEFNESGDCD